MLDDVAELRRLESLAFRWHAPATPGLLARGGDVHPGSSRQFIGVRAWQPGDDVRDLDWASTLRFRRAHTRVYERSIEGRLLLLVDVSASMAFGQPSKVEYARHLAGALGYVALAHHDLVGAVAFADGPAARLPVGRGRTHWRRLRMFLAALTAGGQTVLDDVVDPHEASVGLCLVLSDFYVPAVFERALERLRRRSARVVALQLLSPQELEPDLDGDLTLVDAESGQVRVGAVGRPERGAAREALRGLVAEIAGICRARGALHLVIPTTTPITHCLHESLVRHRILARSTSR